MKTRIEHIFFDLDHTLWDFDRNSAIAFSKLFKKFGIHLKLEEFLAIYQPINLKYWKCYREEKVSKVDLRRRRLLESFEHFGIKFPLEVIDLIADNYIKFLPHTNHLIPGTIEVLEYLKPNYTLHIITNGFREIQQLKLEKSGILPYFKTVTNSEDAGVKKPHPKIFNMALQISGASIKNSLMIGDSYEADILGASAIGLNGICFNYHMENLPRDILQIMELKQLKDHL